MRGGRGANLSTREGGGGQERNNEGGLLAGGLNCSGSSSSANKHGQAIFTPSPNCLCPPGYAAFVRLSSLLKIAESRRAIYQAIPQVTARVQTATAKRGHECKSRASPGVSPKVPARPRLEQPRASLFCITLHCMGGLWRACVCGGRVSHERERLRTGGTGRAQTPGGRRGRCH